MQGTYIGLLPREIQLELREYCTPVKILATRAPLPVAQRARRAVWIVIRIEGRTYVVVMSMPKFLFGMCVAYQRAWLLGYGLVSFNLGEPSVIEETLTEADVRTLIFGKETTRALRKAIRGILENASSQPPGTDNREYWRGIERACTRHHLS